MIKYLCLNLAFSIVTILHSQSTKFLSESQAKEEALIAINHIKNSHPNQYWENNRNIWDLYEKKLISRKGNITIGQHYFDLAYLFSLTNDTHTQIYPDKESPGFDRVFPIRFRTFSDGLYVISANEDYEHYIGKKVVSLGNKSAFEFMTHLSDYVSADNITRKHTLAEFLLVMPETYEVFGLTQNGYVELVLEDKNGNKISGKLDVAESKSFSKVFFEEPNSFGILVPDKWLTIYDVFGVEIPITRKNLRRNYWHATIINQQDSIVEYIQINKNENELDGETQFDFLLRIFQEIRGKGNKVKRIIIDLRYNLGGWIKNTATLSGLLYGSDFYKHEKTTILIGRETISAGTILAADIEGKNYAYFIGEPTGSKPNMFLEHAQVDLPYSKFYAESSTSSYITTNCSDTRRFLAPDLYIYESFANFISGGDITLKKALGLKDEDVVYDFEGLDREDLWRRTSQRIAID